MCRRRRVCSAVKKNLFRITFLTPSVCVWVLRVTFLRKWLWIFTGQEGSEGREWSEGGEEGGNRMKTGRKEGVGQDRVGLRETPPQEYRQMGVTGSRTGKHYWRICWACMFFTLIYCVHLCGFFTNSFLMGALCHPEDPSASVRFPFPSIDKTIKFELSVLRKDDKSTYPVTSFCWTTHHQMFTYRKYR